jgi:hypothetical protein
LIIFFPFTKHKPSLAGLTSATMGDFTNYGGTEEENAEIKRLNAELVS